MSPSTGVAEAAADNPGNRRSERRKAAADKGRARVHALNLAIRHMAKTAYLDVYSYDRTAIRSKVVDA